MVWRVHRELALPRMGTCGLVSSQRRAVHIEWRGALSTEDVVVFNSPENFLPGSS